MWVDATRHDQLAGSVNDSGAIRRLKPGRYLGDQAIPQQHI